MKKLLIIFLLILLTTSVFCQNSLPFSKGINMLTYFETWHQGELPNLNKHDEADFVCLKDMGVEVIRLPVHFENLMEPYGTGKIYDIIFERLDQVCDWAEKYQIYLVIDNHSFNSEEEDNNPPSAEFYKKHLEAVWAQVADRYKNRSKYIIYEIINEPKSKGDISQKWVKLQQEIIDLIRSYDPERKIVVTSSNFSSIDTLVKMKPYKDPNLIYTFHFYEPHIFTHQGATWVGKEMMDLEGLPFPYDRKRLPKLKGNAKNSWVQWQIENEYYLTGTAKYINNRIKKVADWAKKNKVPVWCGEIGANIWTDSTDRLSWINATRNALIDNDIPYCCWGLDGGFGFLKSDKSGYIFPDDIDKATFEAYGFTMPDKKLTEKTGINITTQKPYLVYNGLLGKGADKTCWGNIKELIKDSTHNYCISISYPGKQNGCKFGLPNKIISKITENPQSFSVSLSVMFTDNKQEFYLNLSDSDQGAELPPWNISVTIKASDYKIGEWVTVEIPFSRFTESGAWSEKANNWFEPQGKFDWSRFERIYIDLDDWDNKKIGTFYIDDIVIKKK